MCTTPGQNATCEGDSGGPMICNGLQYGICSFALNFYGEKENICGSKNLQTVHVFIFYYREWINDIIESVILVTTEEPDITTKQPDITTEQPDITMEQPDITAEEPDITTKKPKPKKKKMKKKKSAGELIKPHYTLFMISNYFMILSFNRN